MTKIIFQGGCPIKMDYKNIAVNKYKFKLHKKQSNKVLDMLKVNNQETKRTLIDVVQVSLWITRKRFNILFYQGVIIVLWFTLLTLSMQSFTG